MVALARWLGGCLLLTLPLAAKADDRDLFSPDRVQHWAWKPLTQAAIPIVKRATWVRTPVDSFILSKLEQAGLGPAGPATRAHLLRRVTFDLIGLPPSPEELAAFESDSSPQAWDRVIDRLLDSPHYGERWARHWLDVARYADSNGYEHDEPRPNAWRYRDYVVRAFNTDKPYNRFLLEQLAGDELYPDDPDALIATGFNLLGPDMTDAQDQELRRLNALNDMTDTAGLAFMGMTIACARCHDHKFEPISQRDYYRLQAFFAPAALRADVPAVTPEEREKHHRAMESYLRLTQPAREAITKLEDPYRRQLLDKKLARLSEEAQSAHLTPPEKRTPRQQQVVAETARLATVGLKEIHKALSKNDAERLAALQAEIKSHESAKPPPLPVGMGLTDKAGQPPKTYLLERGVGGNRGEEVQAGYPTVLLPGLRIAPAKVTPPNPNTTGRRAALAQWLIHPEHPLTARVFVNRIWQHHFGKGLVATANDFGLRGQAPSHPELLDWLALELQASGWSIKALHRVILRSATYQQSTNASKLALELDPENRLLSRMRRLRLEGEAIRDSLLALSNRLSRRIGGPGCFPPLPKEKLPGFAGWEISPNSADRARRSLYIFARRNLRYPFLEAFDLPDSNQSCSRRERSTTAPQALALLHADDVLQAAIALSSPDAGLRGSDVEWISRIYVRILGREPNRIELQQATAFLLDSPRQELCRALMNLNEFVYLD